MNIKLFNVAPSLPKELDFLETLADNIWWCWHPSAIELFKKIAPGLWREMGSDAKSFLSKIPQERFNELAKDSGYLRQIKNVKAEFEKAVYVNQDEKSRSIAYFSMEYGIHESVRLYSGGLGILSGDHLKAASDLKLPLVAVGLLYRQGYFRQFLDRNGWQMERYPENELHNMPMKRAKDEKGNEITLSINLNNRELFFGVWILNVGNIPLVLLDTGIQKNPPDFKEITWRLYGGDTIMRLHQEILLGIGGFKALTALGYDPAVCHMNEGHAAFLSLARIEHLVSKGYDTNVALEIVWRTNVFTTHTPVPAGNEVFDIGLLRPYLQPFACAAGLDVDRVIRWGIPINEREHSKEMSMTVLGLRLANFSNGVSKLHGVVARDMWKHLWPGRSVDELPITHITNGVHIESWISSRLSRILEDYLNVQWKDNADMDSLLKELDTIPDEDFWMIHEISRQALVRKIRIFIKNKFALTNENQSVNDKNILDPSILTIGFARRFATYKRGTLLLRNRERLLKLLRDTKQPIQFVFAGKAHPADNGGKHLIQELTKFAKEENVQHRFIFVEDYDISLARTLMQGVDVWLNTPRRPMEASGTSGMKAAANGALNCSILDGWWDEAYQPETGWAIPGNSNFTNDEDIDNYESQSLFQILENEIIPCFYERVGGDVPNRWVKKMKAAIAMAISKFSSCRMVSDYNKMFYIPGVQSYEDLMRNDADQAKSIMLQKVRLESYFKQIYVHEPIVDRDLNYLHVGETFKIQVKVYLGEFKPEELKVEAYYGTVDNHNAIIHSNSDEMTQVAEYGDGNYLYECTVSCKASGRFGLTARVTPANNVWENSVPGFLAWPK